MPPGLLGIPPGIESSGMPPGLPGMPPGLPGIPPGIESSGMSPSSGIGGMGFGSEGLLGSRPPGPFGSIGSIGLIGSGSFLSGTSGNSGTSGVKGPQSLHGNFHHHGKSRMIHIPSHQHPSFLPSFGTWLSMWFSIWDMALAEKVLEHVRLGFITAPDTWLLPALCPSSCITRPTLHPREAWVAWLIPYSYSPL